MKKNVNDFIGIQKSNTDKIKKLTYQNEKGYYYTIPFVVGEENTLCICVSSQIGCPERCSFCATGDKSFKGNITQENIQKQIEDGIQEGEIFGKKENLFLAFEGMGEATYNLHNICNCLNTIKPKLLRTFESVNISISTAGNNIEAIIPYVDTIKNITTEKMRIKIQLSIHAIFDTRIKKNEPREEIAKILEKKFKKAYEICEQIGEKLIVNYLLLEYKQGKNNYNKAFLDLLTQYIDPEKTKIKLTEYAQTYKEFSSPNKYTYETIGKIFKNTGCETYYAEIIGKDINAGCGMLEYENTKT